MHSVAKGAIPLVFLGGAMGALLRWQFGLLFANDFWSLMIVNVSGSMAIGVVSSLRTTSLFKAFLQTGFLGSFTSMSALIALISPSLSSLEALLAILITFVVAPLSVVLGVKLVKLQS